MKRTQVSGSGRIKIKRALALGWKPGMRIAQVLRPRRAQLEGVG